MTQTESKQTIASSSPALTAMLENLCRSGIEFLPRPNGDRVRQLQLSHGSEKHPLVKSEAVSEPIVATAAIPAPRSRLAPAPESPPALLPASKPYTGQLLSLAMRTTMLADIAGEIAQCTRCTALACQRTLTVPGEGNPQARVCFMGEAPGADEDASGRPFVGRAGQLLTKMIEACTFTREDVFILNTIKCRPPGNRNPEFQESENCRGYLDRQLEIIQPEYIVCLGLIAAQAILNTKLSVGRLRGQFHDYRGSKVLVTYHPSYLLREPAIKKAAWADLQFLLRDMGIELPKK